MELPLVDRVVVIDAAGGAGEGRRLAQVGARGGEHVRVPRKVNVIRRHEEVVCVAVLPHEAEKLHVPRGNRSGTPLAARRL